MEFEVTATKKRPQTLGELTGQDFVVATLKSSIENGRIAHAYLFAGPRGVGKTSSARILARSLNCEEGPSVNPCGRCSNCLEIARGNSLDVIEIDGASNTSVNDIREIKDEVLFSPNSSRYKIYIIDEVHMLSNSAFNALLKTIEEPPPYIVFIFATTEIHKVPATIRSRCQQFNFRLISLDMIKGLLADICREQNVQFEDDALMWIAKESTGSLRDAYTLFDQVVSFSEGNITLDKIREKLGIVGLDQMNILAELMMDGKTKEVLELMDSILLNGVPVEQFLQELAEYYRNLLILSHKIEKESILGVSPERFSEKVRTYYSSEQIHFALDKVFDLFRNIRFSVNQKYELELLLSRFCFLDNLISPQSLINQLGEMRADISELSQTSASGSLLQDGLKKKIH